ncbi:transmembrane and coiled-coil domain-containing protein 4-like isoform X2 [Ipomoea triloba]|uniref:transmembrane and coiled-coil domain-containing protein 4-like isoform X2 n=1 Tax=Ipomoea triloba TaxID=35885 RepID=UPI00125E0905|nr:transmembrane and coiled-coil domain-containing protein 4-like isoform X2 [Ipomoea triloba]
MSSSTSSSSILAPTQRYAAAALLGLALYQAQIHQTRPLGVPSDGGEDLTQDRISSGSSSSSDSVAEDPQLWVHQSSSLLRPVFKFLEIDPIAWTGIEETAGHAPANRHVGAFLRLLSEGSGDDSSEALDREITLANSIDAMASSIEKTVDIESEKEKLREYENECREKFSTADSESMPEGEATHVENQQVTETIGKPSSSGHAHMEPISGFDEKPAKDLKVLSYHRKLAVLYELLSACLAAIPEDNKNASTQRRRGYDARYRVALRLLATWFDVKWVKVEAIETMVACSAMALLKAQESKEEAESSKSRWAKWRRGGIIGAAALTGGTLMAITGGLAAPAIAAGFGALAPTLGTLVPVIGASGFAAVATAAGSVVGSVAVAASFGAAGAGLTGTKVARRIGDVDEFEFKTIGENHNKGRLAVEILITGFVIEESDFFRPWEGEYNNLERYALQWESKHLIAVSYAIRNWLTSSIALELMKRGAMMTVLSSILAALAWPATLLALTHFIDSEWTIAVDRSDKAGILLAEVLQKGLQGHRPVTLVGFSLGARVIFKCLEILAASGNNAGLVERVVLLGAPIKIRDVNWEAVRKVVAGRFVNVYSTNDWMLGIVFRASLLTQGLAGIQPVDVPGVENVDVTELIDGHSAYLWTSQEILELLQLDTYYPVFGRASVKR